MTDNEKYAVFLRHLANNPYNDQTMGTCLYFRRHFDVRLMSHVPRDVCDTWPHFSDDHEYPVPSGTACTNPYDAFRTLPLWSGPYGKLRRSWCLHLAKYFERLDNDNPHG